MFIDQDKNSDNDPEGVAYKSKKMFRNLPKGYMIKSTCQRRYCIRFINKPFGLPIAEGIYISTN